MFGATGPCCYCHGSIPIVITCGCATGRTFSTHFARCYVWMSRTLKVLIMDLPCAVISYSDLKDM